MPKTPRLREWRERAALSQTELAERSGTSRATIADLEAGNRGGQPKTVRRLAEALGVEPEDLYGGEYPKGEAPPTPQPSFNDVLDEDFDRWLEGATLAEVHKAMVELNRAARAASGEERYRLVNRATKAIDRFTQLAGPFTEWRDRRPRTQATDESQEGREAG